MALWAKVQELTGEPMRQLQAVYGVHFPIEVRHFFAPWIEEQAWSTIDEDNSQHEQFAVELRDSLIGMLENKASELTQDDMFLTKLKLQETLQQFREMYGHNPMNLVRVVKNCLATDQRMVQYATNNGGHSSEQAQVHKQILSQFELLQRYTSDAESELRQLQQKQESFIIQYQESLKINGQLQLLANQPNGHSRIESENKLQAEKQKVENQLSQKAQDLLHLRLKLADRHEETFKTLESLQNHILDDQLINWKRQQQLAGNGAVFEEGTLETLQQWCECLADLIWSNRQQVRKVELLRAQLPIDVPPMTQDKLPMLNNKITSLLSSLVTSTFIIEKQPPQVLKKDSRYTATVRLLVGGKLNVHMNPPTVKATIISEEQAKSLLKNDKNVKNDCSGEILNNQGTMEYHSANGQLAVTFRNMALKRIRRAEKKGNETVTEEKFSILFQSQFTVGGGELVFQVWTLSLPVVVIVHGNQECNASATVLWDNAFAEPGRVPFQIPDKVKWADLAECLNTRFAADCGLGLSTDNVNYLASKLFGQSEDFTHFMVSWSQFNREPLPGRNFTFWEWFYAIKKLTKDWLAAPWKEGCITGFIAREHAQECLLRRGPGTFLLRFSDSEIGGITIAWVRGGETNNVWNLAPFTEKDFRIRGLGDRVKDLPHLQVLYPDTPKAKAFSKFWSQTVIDPLSQDGYVRPDLAVVIPGMNQPSEPMTYDNPHTPMGIQPQSPSSQSYEQMGAHDANQDGMETMEGNDIDPITEFNMTDYNPGDIEQINVNELLMQYNKSTP